MDLHRRAGRPFALGFSVALALSAALPMSVLGNEPPSTATNLGLEDERLLSDAVVEGRSEVTVLIAAKGGAAHQAADAVAAVGGRVQYRDNELGYLRAAVPVVAVRRLAANPSIEAIDLDQVVEVPDPRPEAMVAATNRPPPDETTPRANPYMPIQDTGVAAFLEEHPTWDGRGVTIGIVDTGVALDHPSLTTTSTGERKIVDWVTGTDPLTEPDPTWVNMSTQVTGTTFQHAEVTWTAPAAGTYRIGVFDESDPRLGGEVGNDVNRDGDKVDTYGVLWNTDTNQVWVDANTDRSFADEAAMTDYKVNYDVGWFGSDDPATAVAERMPFVVQTDGQNKFVNIGVVSGFHGSHVAGIGAGHSLFGGEMSGAAPGAQIVSLRACLFVAGCTSHALLEGMIYVAKEANVDVINMSIGGLPGLNDGNNARCRLYGRLIEQSNVQMYFSIGNSGPGLNTAGDPGLCDKVIGMGAYLTDATMFADYGVEVGHEHNLHYFTSRGPREDGSFKPDAVAPGAAISTTPLWQQLPGIAHVPALPPGYALANGTSMAAPQTAGLGAVLVSAAEQSGVQHQPAQIRQALLSSAQYLEDERFQAYDQGAGLLNVQGAWSLLQQKIQPVTITGRAPVNTVLSNFLAQRNTGSGIYLREGVAAGVSQTVSYSFTRADGPGGSRTYGVSWVGNDGTFSSASSVTLPKGGSVAFNVTVNPQTTGAHSAILQLDDPATPGIEYRSMNTVIAADRFTAEAGYSVTKTGTIDRAQTEHFFFEVPAGTPAFKVDMDAGGTEPGAGQIRFLRWSPWGLGADANSVSNCYNPPVAPNTCSTGSPLSRTVVEPMAGVWEVTVDARRTSDADDAPFTLTASILGASVDPDPLVIPEAQIDVPVDAEWTITNEFGAFTGRAVGTAMGSAAVATPSIGNHEVQEYQVVVPEGASSLRATIGNPSDPAADLDLFVLNPDGDVEDDSADGDSEESVTIAKPEAGTWTVVVDGYAVPAGATTYDYIDVFFTEDPMGQVSVTDADALRGAGASWTVSGTVTAHVAPEEGRVLYGSVEVRTNENVLVGRGDVIVQSVSGP